MEILFYIQISTLNDSELMQVLKMNKNMVNIVALPFQNPFNLLSI